MHGSCSVRVLDVVQDGFIHFVAVALQEEHRGIGRQAASLHDVQDVGGDIRGRQIARTRRRYCLRMSVLRKLRLRGGGSRWTVAQLQNRACEGGSIRRCRVA